MSTTIYYNPGCSKCRLTKELLQTKGVEATVVEYLNTPPNATTLTDVLSLLKMEPRDLMRKHEAEYKDNNLDDASLTREQLIDAMVKFPRLIERPIVVTEHDGQRKAAIGRPPETILDIL